MSPVWSPFGHLDLDSAFSLSGAFQYPVVLIFIAIASELSTGLALGPNDEGALPRMS
jgi:hypothetical protein